MGSSNVATATASLMAVITGGALMDAVNTALGYGMGPRAAFLLAAGSFVIGALLLRPVHELGPARARVAAEGSIAA